MSARSAVVTVALATLIGSGHTPLPAQSIPKMLGDNVRNAATDAWDVWTSPLRSRPNDWLTAAGIVALSAAASPWDDDVDRWAVRQRNDKTFEVLKPFRSGGAAYSGRTITPVALGVLAVSLVTKNEKLQEGLFGCATAYGASSIVRTFVIYPLIARTRPDPRPPTGAPPPASEGDQYRFAFPGSSDWGEHSFPGGHIANVVACAEFVTNRFSMGVTEPAIWAVAGGIGLGRVLDRGHWASDQLLGVAFGYAVGRQVALRSKHRAERKTSDRTTTNGTELFIGPSHDGLRVGWSRSF